MVYDTIYAHQDKRDDVSAGVKSTALLFGDRTKQWLSGFATAHVACLALTGVNAGCGALYFAGVAAAAAHMAWQIRTVDLNSGRDCATKFVSNTQYGGIVMSGIMGDKLLPLLLG